MDEKFIEVIKRELSQRETEELIEIWRLHDTDQFYPETFAAIRQILTDRLEELPSFENRDEADLHLHLAEESLNQGELDLALSEASRSVDIAPHYHCAYYIQGLVYEAMGWNWSAAACFRQSIHLHPDFKDVHQHLKSIEAFSNSRANIPKQAHVLDLGYVENLKQDLINRETAELVDIWTIHDPDQFAPEAFEAVRQILLTRMESLPPYEDRDKAEELFEQIRRSLDAGDLTSALDQANLAIQTAPHYGSAYYAQGAVYEEMGNLAEAAAAYGEALSLDPQLPGVRRDLLFVQKEIQQTMPNHFSYRTFLMDVWRILWKNGWAWAFCLLYPIISLSRRWIPNLWQFNCILFPLLWWLFVRVLPTALIRVIYGTISGVQISIKEILRLSFRRSFGVILLSLMTELFLAPLLLVSLAILYPPYFNTHPWINNFLLMSICVLIILSVGIASSYTFIEVVVSPNFEMMGIIKGLLRGIKGGICIYLKNKTKSMLAALILVNLYLLFYITPTIYVSLRIPHTGHSWVEMAVSSASIAVNIFFLVLFSVTNTLLYCRLNNRPGPLTNSGLSSGNPDS